MCLKTLIINNNLYLCTLVCDDITTYNKITDKN